MKLPGSECKSLERSVKNRASKACTRAGAFGQICKYGYLKDTSAGFIIFHLDN